MRNLIIGLLLAAFLPNAHAYPAASRAEIFYVPWSVFTAHALTPDDVRKRADFFIRIAGITQVAAFAEGLPQFQIPNADTSALGDVRLVIDFYDEKGQRTSFFADYHKLGTEDGRKTIGIDQNFRSTFFQFLSP